MPATIRGGDVAGLSAFFVADEPHGVQSLTLPPRVKPFPRIANRTLRIGRYNGAPAASLVTSYFRIIDSQLKSVGISLCCSCLLGGRYRRRRWCWRNCRPTSESLRVASTVRRFYEASIAVRRLMYGAKLDGVLFGGIVLVELRDFLIDTFRHVVFSNRVSGAFARDAGAVRRFFRVRTWSVMTVERRLYRETIGILHALLQDLFVGGEA